MAYKKCHRINNKMKKIENFTCVICISLKCFLSTEVELFYLEAVFVGRKC